MSLGMKVTSGVNDDEHPRRDQILDNHRQSKTNNSHQIHLLRLDGLPPKVCGRVPVMFGPLTETMESSSAFDTGLRKQKIGTKTTQGFCL